MKTGAMSSITSGLSILSLSLLLIVSFSTEASAKRGCSVFGHSCYGGHGKRSTPDDETRLGNADSASTTDVIVKLRSNEIQNLRDFLKCRNCAVELSHRSRDDQNYMPLLLRQLLVSYRRPYNNDLTTNDK